MAVLANPTERKTLVVVSGSDVDLRRELCLVKVPPKAAPAPAPPALDGAHVEPGHRRSHS